jgi:hypothetical protein
MEKTVVLSDLPADRLNKEMQGMTPEQRATFIEGKIRERKECQAQIGEVNLRRQEFIQKKLAELGAGEQDSFDRLVFATLKKQCKRAGLSFGEESK